MEDKWHPESGPDGFLAATADQARLVLDADDGWPTYEAGLEFQGLAMTAMAATPKGEFLPDTPTALNLIWGALTDEMDAPGRGTREQDAAAVRHMKQAAAEWLEKMGSRKAEPPTAIAGYTINAATKEGNRERPGLAGSTVASTASVPWFSALNSATYLLVARPLPGQAWSR